MARCSRVFMGRSGGKVDYATGQSRSRGYGGVRRGNRLNWAIWASRCIGMNSKVRILTGITTTGTPHLGNYVGAIRPAIAASRDASAESFYFLADYHALVKCDDPARVQRST